MALGYSQHNTQRSIDCYRDMDGCLHKHRYPTGGHTLRYHLELAGRSLPDSPFNGLDIVCATVYPSVTERFLIVHRHPDGYWALVHTATGVKVNVFPPRHQNPLIPVELLPGFRVKIQTAADQLVSTVEDLLKLEKNLPVDPKLFDNARRLIGITTPADRDAAWNARHPGQTFSAAFEAASHAAELHPELVKTGLYTNIRHLARQLFLPRRDCIHTDPKFPIASKLQVARRFRR